MLLADVDARDSGCFPGLLLAVLVVDGVLEEARAEDHFLVGANGRVGVPEDLEQADPADRFAEFLGGEGGGGLEGVVGLCGQAVGDGGPAQPEGDHVSGDFACPGGVGDLDGVVVWVWVGGAGRHFGGFYCCC